MDTSLEKINKFISNWKDKHDDVSLLNGHSIYLLQTEDMDGNITGEAFALNVTTKRYFWGYFSNDQEAPSVGSYIGYLFIGDGTYNDYGDISPDSSSLNHVTYASSAIQISDNQTRIESSTFYWDSDNSLLHASAFVYSGYFDYVLSGINSDLSITEIGLSTSNDNTQLATHAYVYDEEGHYSSIVKHVNEKLTINAYIRIFHKPGYIENKLWNLGYGFAWNPWGCFAFGYHGTGYYSSSHYNGTVGTICENLICSPRWNSSNAIGYSDESDTRSSMIIRGVVSPWEGTMNQSNQIVTTSRSFASVNSLIEDKDYYYDLLVLSLINTYNNSENKCSYCAQGTIIKEMELPTSEEISTDVAYCRSINTADLSANFGYRDNSRYDICGLLPVTKMNISTVKSYNGISHEWDIDETILNGNNQVNLTMMQLYPWVGMYMNCPYMDGETLKEGRQFVRIYFNMYTSYPITSIETESLDGNNVWCTDTYWDPTSWVRISDPSSISGSSSTKKYYISFGGTITGNGGPQTSTKPIVVTRSGYTIPTMVSDNTIQIDSIDTYDNGNYGYASAAYDRLSKDNVYGVRMLSNDTMGYIWMAYHLYYPDDSDLSTPGISWKIQTSQPVGDMGDPIPTLRFTEPTGHRILQIFRGTNHNEYVAPCLSKVSVFDIPSKTDVLNDPTLTPTEYVVELGNTFANNVNYDTQKNYLITSTETGYVVFGNPDSNRIHVVNILGDVSSSYEPYQYILKYPNTNNEIQTGLCWAIKYTSNVVYYDSNISTDVVDGYTILDLSTNTVVDQFTIEKSFWGTGGLKWISGWKNILYITGNTGSDINSTWKCKIYNPTYTQGSRLLQPDMTSIQCRAMMPGGDKDNWRSCMWVKMINPHLFGDESCIIFTYTKTSSSIAQLYYVDEDNPTTFIDFAENSGIETKYVGDYMAYGRQDVHVNSFNNNKQRIISFDTNNIFYAKSSYSSDQNEYKSFYFDANWIRDNQMGPSHINVSVDAIPTLITGIDESSYVKTSVRSSCMYKGKILISEYSPMYTVNNSQYTSVTTNIHRFVDPNRLLPHKMTGTTTSIQAYNNPKRIYGIQNVTTKIINSATIWDPSDM